MLEFDTICGEGKNYTGNVNMKTLMNTAMKTIMKSSLCALAALSAAPMALAGTYIWNTNVTEGNMSEPANWLVDGLPASVAPGASDDVVIQSSMTNQWQNIKVTFDSNITFKSLALSGRVEVKAGGSVVNAGKRILGEGCPKFICKSGSTFGKFESTGACAVLETSPNSFSITDKSSVKTYNGVAPHLAATSNNGGPCEILKLSADGLLVEAGDADYVRDDIMSAGEDDSVCLTDASSYVALTGDVTINALKMYGGSVLDLGGHTLTVKSGVIRPRRDGNWTNRGVISNGVVKVCDQFFYIYGVGANPEQFAVTLDTSWNTDPLKQVFDYWVADYARTPISRDDMSRFFGVYRTRQRLSSNIANATNMILDTGYGNWIGNGYLSDHSLTANLRGIAGNSSVTSKDKFHGRLWLGDDADFTCDDYSCVVGRNGYLVPGGLSYDGYRVGSLRFDDTAMDLRCYRKLAFKQGSHLVATVRPDGTSTMVTTSGTSQYRCFVTIEGGNIDVIECGKVKQGTWTVMRTVDAVTGTFDSVTSGYKAKYNVEVEEDGVTYYELQLTKSSSGTIIIIR